MSLNKKVAMIVLIIFAISSAASLFVQRGLIMPSFVSLERDTAQRNLTRAIGGVERELALIQPSLYDWASWTDTYQYAQGEYPEYEEENFVDSTLPALQINYLGVMRMDGATLYAEGRELEGGENVDLGVLTQDRLPADHPLMQIETETDQVSGLIQTPQGPMMVQSRPILTNEDGGPPAGVMAMGRLLDEAAVARLVTQTQLDITAVPAESEQASWAETSSVGVPRTEPTLTELDNQWRGAVQLGDVSGKPILELAVDTPREISDRGGDAITVAVVWLVATGLVTMLVLWLALRQVLLRPLQALAVHAERVGASGKLEERMSLSRSDELGVLAQNFDGMMDSLAQARRKLVDQSYRSGIAEMAGGVLHNIGNAITPLSVTLQTLSGDLRAAPNAELRQAIGELADDSTPAQRRGDLTRFVELASADLVDLVDASRTEVDDANRQVSDIAGILRDQERSSRSARVIETIDMGELIDEAAVALKGAGHATMRVDIDASVRECGPVRGSRAALQQVLTNLLVNAAEAVEETRSAFGRLSISAHTAERDGVRAVCYRFADNGAGVPAEHRDQIFRLGFSTKNRDGSGYGLHWTANTVAALGGELRLLDPDQGACFEVSLASADVVTHSGSATGTEG